MARGYIIKTDGTRKIVEFEVGNSYNTIKEAVGGYIECVSINEEMDIWLNEEGKLIGLEPNLYATALYRARYNTTDFIVGDVIITGGANEEGETLGLSDEMLAPLMLMQI
jgi:hypothetical protein